jgi:hypothetical protein
MNEFEREALKGRASLGREFIDFLASNKKWWLLPMILCLLLLGLLICFAGTGAAPFVYTLF